MRKNSKNILLLGILLIAISISGCQTKTTKKPNLQTKTRIGNKIAPTTPKRTQNRINQNLRNYNRVNNTKINQNFTQNDLTNKNISNRSENIARKIANLSEVNSATVILNRNTALVGVDIKRNLEGRLTDNLKRKIEKIVKDTDKNIVNVGISADADVYKRISNMARDIRNGKPITGFTKEFEEIFRRITPSR